jgi:ATP-dependent Clp protease ATP-binding subunit ClpC
VCLQEDVHIQEVFFDSGITQEDLTNASEWLRINRRLVAQYQKYVRAGSLRSSSGIDRAMTSLSTQYLDTLSQDITRLAQRGVLDLFVGREKELDELYRVFDSGSKNIILIGAPGVGVTALVEGLAEKIVGDDAPEYLKEKRIVSLSISQLLSGVSGSQAQQRLLQALYDAVQAKNVVVYIDNVHELAGVSSSQGFDLTGVLAEILQKNLLYCIVSTTPEQYAGVIEKTSLASFMRPIRLLEMDQQSAIQVLESKVGYVENKEGVIFSYQALKKIVEYTDRYMHDQAMPAKAIAIMQELGVFVRNQKGSGAVVTAEDVATLLTQKLGIPIVEASQAEASQLLNMEDILHERVIGQDEAVKAVAVALKRARTQLRDTKRPIASMLFLGSTGVGKTELTKAIAASYFGNEDAMVRLDMSEYQNTSDLNKMIGAATGTGGSQQGLLTEAVRRNPYTIVLLDEIEKAHPDILNLFLQVMEDGRLTDAAGKTVDFTNTIIIATSNAGSQYIQDSLQSGVALEGIKEELLGGRLREYFKPEFINRFDNVILFKQLSKDDVRAIAELMMRDVVVRLEEKGVHLVVTKEALFELAEKGYDPVYGARPLRRVIQDEVDNALAEFLLQGKLDRRDVVVLDAGMQLRIEKAKQL